MYILHRKIVVVSCKHCINIFTSKIRSKSLPLNVFTAYNVLFFVLCAWALSSSAFIPSSDLNLNLFELSLDILKTKQRRRELCPCMIHLFCTLINQSARLNSLGYIIMCNMVAILWLNMNVDLLYSYQYINILLWST